MIEENGRIKSSLRIQYEAQVSVIQRQIGSLENVRINMGLSQRKMAQLLLVDPSAWTRWVSDEKRVPPHIWRALQWYISLQEKIPGLTPQYFLGGDAKQLQAQIERNITTKLDDQFLLSHKSQSELITAAQNSALQRHEIVKNDLQNQIQKLTQQNKKIQFLIWALVFGNIVAAFLLIRGH